MFILIGLKDNYQAGRQTLQALPATGCDLHNSSLAPFQSKSAYTHCLKREATPRKPCNPQFCEQVDGYLVNNPQCVNVSLALSSLYNLIINQLQALITSCKAQRRIVLFPLSAFLPPSNDKLPAYSLIPPVVDS
jgi:hypothetical protein